MLGGLGIIVTAIVHPEGVAPFFGAPMRHAGNWLVSAIPGAETIRTEYRGSRSKLVKAVCAAGVIGTALWLYNAQFIENVYLWILFSAALLLVVSMLFAASLGSITPSFASAGGQWVGWAKRFGPTALAGYVAGWLIWPIRLPDVYSNVWMPILGALLALFARSIILQIIHGREHAEETPPGPPPSQPTPAAEKTGDMITAEVG